MGCYECGSPDGDQLRLCPDCIAKRRNRRAAVKEEATKVDETPDTAYELMNDPYAIAAGFLNLVTLCFVFFLFAGPVSAEGVLPSLLFGLMVANSIISVLVYLFFLVRMLTMDTMWGVMTLLFPFLMGRYIMVNWDDAAVRKYTFISIATFAVSLILAKGLADQLDVSVWRVWSIYELYTAGADVHVREQPGLGMFFF